MSQLWKRPLTWALVAAMTLSVMLAGAGVFTASAQNPIKIGFGMALTGGLSANGKPALLAVQIWKDDVNKKGGLLGRPVELVFYDDQTNPSTVPNIYTKLLDVDKVDLIISGYGTNLIMRITKTMQLALEDIRSGKFALMGTGVTLEEYLSAVGIERWADIENRHAGTQALRPDKT